MTPDGSRVVFLVNPDITQYGAGEWKLGLLNGQSGELLWQVSGADKYLEGLEAAISPDGSFVAAGSTNGALGLLNGSTGELTWQQDTGTYGQVRKLVFSRNICTSGREMDASKIKMVMALKFGKVMWVAGHSFWDSRSMRIPD